MLGLQVPEEEMDVLVSTGSQSSSATTLFVTHSVAVALSASQSLQSRYARGGIDIRREGVFRALVDLLVALARVVNTVASVATSKLNLVRVSTGELLESVAGVLKGLDLGQLDVSVEVVTDVAHMTEEFHGSIQNEIDDVDGDVDDLEDGVNPASRSLATMAWAG
jgi:hypothetical protein